MNNGKHFPIPLKLLVWATFLFALSTCHLWQKKTIVPQNLKSHSKEAWLLKLSIDNKISLKEQTKLDNEIASDGVPHFLKKDAMAMQEAAVIWRDDCSNCHGMDGEARIVEGSDIKSRNFGTMAMQMGFFFGGDKMRTGIFHKISEGSSKDGLELMPSYSRKLSQQQIWSLVFYLENL